MALDVPVFDEKAFAFVAFLPCAPVKGNPKEVHPAEKFPINIWEASAGSILAALTAGQLPYSREVNNPKEALAAVADLSKIPWLQDRPIFSVHPSRVLAPMLKFDAIRTGGPALLPNRTFIDICETFYNGTVLTFQERANFGLKEGEWLGINPDTCPDFENIPRVLRATYAMCKLYV